MNTFRIKANVPQKKDPSERFKVYFQSFVCKINSYGLPENKVDELYGILKDLVSQQLLLSKDLIKIDVPLHFQSQSTFQYIPICKTLQSIFKLEELKDIYFKHNIDNAHSCASEDYHDFCCSSTFQKSSFFKKYPDAIQLQLSIDGVEPCSPLKSKRKLHKICAIYLQIRNIPRRFLSKLSSIYLVALCETEVIKQHYVSLNNILEHIVRDINILQTEGIDIGRNENLYGTLINFSFDNLGGNAVFGFKENFVPNLQSNEKGVPRVM